MTTTTKIDLFREHRDEYVMPKEPTLVRTGPGRYLTVTGAGGPQGDEFARKLGALYGTAYTVKLGHKKAGRDFKVGVLEGLWWTVSGGMDWLTAAKAAVSSSSSRRGDWRWKLLIRVPDFVTARDVSAALKALREKRGSVDDVTLETLREGRVVQMLHVGPYANEPKSIATMDKFVRGEGMRYRGAHHEIYLSDPRRVAPSRLRTILRHPVA